jgi:hypothetical protein
MYDVNLCNILPLLLMPLWVPISATLCRGAVLMLWHAFLFLGLRHFVRRTTFVPFRRFLGDVRREFMQRPSVAPHATLGSYLRDAL